MLLADALEDLPEDYREVIILRQLEGLSFPDVARRMGRTEDSVKNVWLRPGAIAADSERPAIKLARGYLTFGMPQASSKKPAVTIPPDARAVGGISTSMTAKSGNFGTCRALFR